MIGLKDKDRSTRSEPHDDAQFGTYVTNPTLPVLIQALFGVPAPATPRNDLRAGVPDRRRPASTSRANVTAGRDAAAEHRRLPPVPPAAQSPVGVLGGDLAGFPNGRRPGDDVVDIALRAVEGVAAAGASGRSRPGLTDGALSTATIAYTPEGAITGDPAFACSGPSFPVPPDAAVWFAGTNPSIGRTVGQVGQVGRR